MEPESTFEDETAVMRRALTIARSGAGYAEPNPLVGAVIVDDGLNLISEGFHAQFGGPHAEMNAIDRAEGQTNGKQLFVTLEPCSHHGKTPPCTDAVIKAGFRRVVIGCPDPAEHDAKSRNGSGIDQLRAASIEVVTGVCEDEATDLIAPFRKLMATGRPWVHAKWAMTLDGRMASRTGHSKWISSDESRTIVHQLRGRMDAIVTGAGTVNADDPLLTARPPGPRTALRVVIDADAESVQPTSRLMSSLDDAPVLLCVSPEYEKSAHVRELRDMGAQIAPVVVPNRGETAEAVLGELGDRQMTHVLLEAGPGLLGSFFDRQLVDEVHVFVAPKIVGGDKAAAVVGGCGLEQIPEASSLRRMQYRRVSDDILIEGRLAQS